MAASARPSARSWWAASPNCALAHDDPAQEPVGRMLRGDGDAAEDLHRAVGDLAGGARDVGLGDRDRPRRLAGVLVERGRRVEDRRPRAGLAHVHVGEQVAQRLEAADRAAELAPLGGVAARVVEHAARRSDRLGGREQGADGRHPRDRVAAERLGHDRGLRRARPRTSAPSGRTRAAGRRRRRARRRRRRTSAGTVRRGRDHGEARDGAGVLDGRLAAGDGVAARDGLEHGQSGRAPPSSIRARAPRAPPRPLRGPPRAARPRSARRRCPGTGRAPDAAPSARAIRHSSTAPSPSSPPTDSAPNSTRLAHSRPCSPCAREQRVDRFAEPPLLVAELQVHSSYSCGRARTRSAMMLRWICCVPPYTLAARE